MRHGPFGNQIPAIPGRQPYGLARMAQPRERRAGLVECGGSRGAALASGWPRPAQRDGQLTERPSLTSQPGAGHLIPGWRQGRRYFDDGSMANA